MEKINSQRKNDVADECQQVVQHRHEEEDRLTIFTNERKNSERK